MFIELIQKIPVFKHMAEMARWTSLAEAASIRLNKSDLTNSGEGKDTLRPKPDVVKRTLNHLNSGADCVWFPSNVTAFREFASSTELGKAARAFYAGMMDALKDDWESSGDRPDIVAKDQILIPHYDIEDRGLYIAAHTDTAFGNSKPVLLAYAPIHSCRDESPSLFGLCKLGQYNKKKHFQDSTYIKRSFLEKMPHFSPAKEDQVLKNLPFGICVDGKLGHFTTSTIKNPTALKWLMKINLDAYPPYPGYFQLVDAVDQSLFIDGKLNAAAIQKTRDDFIEGTKWKAMTGLKPRNIDQDIESHCSPI
jgi:hypothetical protein